jgi:hypothetical protein
MKVKNLIEIITTTQLKGSKVSDLNDPINKQRIINWINLAIIDINKKLGLYQDYILITHDGIQTKYEMPENYGNIMAVLDPSGRRIAINKEDDPESIFTPEPRKIMIPHIWENIELMIVYISNPDWIQDEEEVLPIGSQFIKAIMHFVSYLAFETIAGDPNYEHHLHLNDYEKELIELRNLGYVPNESIINAGFRMKGYR